MRHLTRSEVKDMEDHCLGEAALRSREEGTSEERTKSLTEDTQEEVKEALK